MKWGKWNAETRARYLGHPLTKEQRAAKHRNAALSSVANAGLMFARTGSPILAGIAGASTFVKAEVGETVVRRGADVLAQTSFAKKVPVDVKEIAYSAAVLSTNIAAMRSGYSDALGVGQAIIDSVASSPMSPAAPTHGSYNTGAISSGGVTLQPTASGPTQTNPHTHGTNQPSTGISEQLQNAYTNGNVIPAEQKRLRHSSEDTGYVLSFEDGSYGYLAHHGIKGMKWGVWNSETRARYTGTGKKPIPKEVSSKIHQLSVQNAATAAAAGGIIGGVRTGNPVLAGASAALSGALTMGYSEAVLRSGFKKGKYTVEDILGTSIAEKMASDDNGSVKKAVSTGHLNDSRFISNWKIGARQAFEEKEKILRETTTYDEQLAKKLSKPYYGESTLVTMIKPTGWVKDEFDTYKSNVSKQAESLFDKNPLTVAHRGKVIGQTNKLNKDVEWYTEIGDKKKAVAAMAKRDVNNDFLDSYDQEDYFDKYDRWHY
jgi:hypothetical protein